MSKNMAIRKIAVKAAALFGLDYTVDLVKARTATSLSSVSALTPSQG